MAEYENAPGVSDEDVTAALIKAHESSEAVREEIKAFPEHARSNRLFLIMQCRAENVVEEMGIKDPKERERQELVVIAQQIRELQGILVEEMSEILGYGK